MARINREDETNQEEIKNGKILQYRIKFGEKIINKKEIECTIVDIINKIAKRISERSL